MQLCLNLEDELLTKSTYSRAVLKCYNRLSTQKAENSILWKVQQSKYKYAESAARSRDCLSALYEMDKTWYFHTALFWRSLWDPRVSSDLPAP